MSKMNEVGDGRKEEEKTVFSDGSITEAKLIAN